jgi:hypothetical protein
VIRIVEGERRGDTPVAAAMMFDRYVLDQYLVPTGSVLVRVLLASVCSRWVRISR